MIRLIIVLVIVIAGDRAIAWVMKRSLSMSESAIARSYTGRASADVIVVGNSRAAKSFDVTEMADQWDLSSLNLGVNGMRPSLVHAFMRDHAEANGYPRMLVLEISYLKNEWDDSVGNEFLVWGAFGHHTQDVIRAKLPKQAIASEFMHLRRFGSQQFFRAILNYRGNDQDTTSKHSISVEAIESATQREAEEFRVSDERLSELREILDQWASAGVDIRLVLAPYLPVFLPKIENLSSWVERIETDLRRPVIDYSDLLSEPSDFADHVHLNVAGRATMMKEFLGEISSDRVPARL